MDLSQLLPDHFLPIRQQISPTSIQIDVLATPSTGICSACQTPSSKVHSFYKRRLADLPISGKPVTLHLHLRKFFCNNVACSRKIFAQTLPAMKPYARRLNRTEHQLQEFALQTGARPAARLCLFTGYLASHSTILRLMRKTSVPIAPTTVGVGVDDFAASAYRFKKGRRYGTILIDLDKHQPVDLLPDREGKTLEDWLRDHPDIELVTRDRSSVYACAITNACPKAIQVADRWHLLANLSEAVEQFLDTQRDAINKSILATLPITDLPTTVESLTEDRLPPFLTWENDWSQLGAMTQTGYNSKRYATYQKVKQLQVEGHGIRAIARHLGMAASAVR